MDGNEQFLIDSRVETAGTSPKTRGVLCYLLQNRVGDVVLPNGVPLRQNDAET